MAEHTITATHAPMKNVCCNKLNPDFKTVCQPPFLYTQKHTCSLIKIKDHCVNVESHPSLLFLTARMATSLQKKKRTSILSLVTRPPWKSSFNISKKLFAVERFNNDLFSSLLYVDSFNGVRKFICQNFKITSSLSPYWILKIFQIH